MAHKPIDKPKKSVAAIIPARMSSTRFPGKPLADICGLPMIEHVRRRVLLCPGLDQVIVATCDQEIFDVVSSNGGAGLMTSSRHERCTDRVAEAAAALDADIIVNIQGDEPLIRPEQIEQVLAPLRETSLCCVNAVAPIDSEEDFQNPNVVKAVLDREGFALYFSREPIPSRKKFAGSFKRFKQLGLMSFTRDFLLKLARLAPTPIEEIESVDMMRALEHGHRIKTVVSEFPALGVDTPADRDRAAKIMREDPLIARYCAAARS